MPSNIKFSPQLQIPNWGHDQWRLLHPRILSHVGITRPHVYWYLFFFIIINMMLTWSTDYTWQGRRLRTLFYSQGCKDWSPLYNHFYPLLPHGRRSILIIKDTFYVDLFFPNAEKYPFSSRSPPPFKRATLHTVNGPISTRFSSIISWSTVFSTTRWPVWSIIDQ